MQSGESWLVLLSAGLLRPLPWALLQLAASGTLRGLMSRAHIKAQRPQSISPAEKMNGQKVR